MFRGAFPRLNPASVHAGLGGEIQPLSIINVRAFANVQQYFGTFGFLQSFAPQAANTPDSYVSQAMPHLIVGFAFESDFLSLLRR